MSQDSSIRLKALIAGSLFFLAVCPFLGIAGIWGSTEAREVHVASVIYKSGEWVLPRRNGLVPSKPPLHHWIAATGASVRGGVTPGVVRAVSLLAASGLIAITLIFTAKISSDLKAGYLSAAVLSTLYPILRLAQDARVDMTFTLFATSALFASLWEMPKLPSKRAMFWFWTLVGFAVLAKGPIGIVIPVVTFIGATAATNGFRAAVWAILEPSFGWLSAFGIIAFWYLPAVYFGSDDFVGRQLLFENINRFIGGDDYREGAWWFYIKELASQVLPWPLLFIVVYSISLIKRKESFLSTISLKTEEPILKALGAAALVGVVFFSLSFGKRGSYLLPIYPIIAAYLGIVASLSFRRASDASKLKVGSLLSQAAPIVSITLIGVAAIFEALKYAAIASVPVTFIISSNLHSEILFIQIVLLGWAAALIFLNSEKKKIASVAASVAVVSACISFGFAVKGELKGFERAAHKINSLVPADEDLFLIKDSRDEYFDPLLYYLDRDVTLTSQDGATGRMIGRKERFDARPGCIVIAQFQTDFESPNSPAKTLALATCGPILES